MTRFRRPLPAPRGARPQPCRPVPPHRDVRPQRAARSAWWRCCCWASSCSRLAGRRGVVAFVVLLAAAASYGVYENRSRPPGARSRCRPTSARPAPGGRRDGWRPAGRAGAMIVRVDELLSPVTGRACARCDSVGGQSGVEIVTVAVAAADRGGAGGDRAPERARGRRAERVRQGHACHADERAARVVATRRPTTCATTAAGASAAGARDDGAVPAPAHGARSASRCCRRASASGWPPR